MRLSFFARLSVCCAASFTFCAPLHSQQADFNEVGKQMAIMLQNSHYAQIKFDENLSHLFLKDYLSDLDPQKLYFTQQDVDHFESKYGNRIHEMLVSREGMEVATDVYDVFKKRANKRVAAAYELLAKNDFDFSKDENTQLVRKDAPWPASESEAADIWRKTIKEAVLGEVLRKDLVSKHAMEQGKKDPGATDRSPREKVKLRYKRFLASVNDADTEEIASGFFKAIARSFDPHTDYMSARETEKFRDDMRNELIGIGALLKSEEDGATKIIGIVVGGPADREGSLKLNDRIVGVDTLNTGKPDDMVDVMFMRISKVVDLIRGKENTTVALKVEPSSGAPGETKIITIPRGKVEMKDEQASADIISIKASEGLPARKIGIIKLPSFYADFENNEVSCSEDVQRLLAKLIQEGIDGLMIDLRNNGGGSLEEVRKMTGFFIGDGPVVQVRRTAGRPMVKDADADEPIYTGPMVVMTDKTSASASEILAGALQDTNRAVIIGESSTFGKGTVQQIMDIGRMFPIFAVRERAGHLKLTIQKFYRPSGSSTQLEGVVPDIRLPGISDALEIGEAYLDNALPHDRIASAPDFKPNDRNFLFIPHLLAASQERVKLNKDFQYTMEDVEKTKKRFEENAVSLNKEKRVNELEESDALKKTRNAERKARYAEMQKDDKDTFTFYRLTLSDLDAGAALKPHDPNEKDSDFMRRAKDDEEDLDDTPEYPSGLDPVERESIAILKDLIGLTDSARVAGVLPKEKERE